MGRVQGIRVLIPLRVNCLFGPYNAHFEEVGYQYVLIPLRVNCLFGRILRLKRFSIPV